MKNKIKNLINDNKNILGILCLFIIIQPFIDILPLFEDERYQIFGFTIPTLVRCLFIGIITLQSIGKIEKKRYKYLAIYFCLLTVYFIIHNHVAGYNSSLVLPDNYVYSISSELFYIIRMLLPISIIYFTSKSGISYKKFINTLLISSAIIGTIIFIGNTFCISYVSYGTGYTKANWLHWFIGDIFKYNFDELTSKGWFYMANQVSGIMILLLPFNLYELIMNKTKLSIYSSTILIISMIMLGTRTAAYGWLIILVLTVLGYLLLLRIYKTERLQNKELAPILIIGLMGIIFLWISPISQRSYGYALGDVDSIATRPEINDNAEEKEKVYKYITDNYSTYGIQKVYVYKIYNYKFDTKFWYDIFDYSKKNGVIENREMQTKISMRIMDVNDNQLKYKLFGYSFSRMRNAGLYMEHDFLVQYFTMGIIGLILLVGPYISIILLMIYKILKNVKRKITFIDYIFMLSVGITLFASLLTGHILDELFVTIYIGFICGYFYEKVMRKVINKGADKYEENKG